MEEQVSQGLLQSISDEQNYVIAHSCAVNIHNGKRKRREKQNSSITDR